MLDYAKVILPKVSFSKELFRKELAKCIRCVDPADVQKFHDWCFQNFNDVYPDVLEEEFSHIAA